MKKTVLLPLLLAAVLALASCGAGNSSSSASEQSASSQATSTESASAQPEKALLGAFTTTDLMKGESVDATIFADYDVTMVNIWATFCGPCLSEMPELGALSTEYADKGVRIVGLVVDVINQDGTLSETQLATARDIAEKTGANYLHLLPSEDLSEVLGSVTAVPTTLFIDKNGNLIGEAQVGSRNADAWRKAIEAARSEVGA